MTNRLPGNITVRVKTELYPVSDSGVSGTCLPSTVSSTIKNWKDRATSVTSSAATTTTPNKNSPMKSQKHKTLFDSPKSSNYGKSGYASPNRVQGTVTTRIKTELCPVTEVCTAATLPTPSPKSLSKSLKEKSENRFQFQSTSVNVPKKLAR